VYEHVSGGGLAEKPVSPSILCEGFGMLRTVSADFQAAGHSVTISLDSRIFAFQPPIDADRILPISTSNQYLQVLKYTSKFVDAAFIIAPESQGTLESIVSEMEDNCPKLMNSPHETISAVRCKDSLAEHARTVGLVAPHSLTLKVRGNMSEACKHIADEIGFPAIIKPLSDAGMSGLSLVKEKTELPEGIRKAAHESGGERFIAQEFAEGVPASVSIVTTGQKAMAMSLNKQNIQLSGGSSPSTYEGGQVPFEHTLKKEALNAAKQIVESYEGLKGYVGVDLVLSEEGPVIIEVNPRLTTSYIGVREVTDYNPAQAILEAALQHKLPGEAPSKGFASFSKVKTSVPSASALKQTYHWKDVVSPPFPISGSSPCVGLMCSNGATPQEAAFQLEDAKNRLHHLSLPRSTER